VLPVFLAAATVVAHAPVPDRCGCVAALVCETFDRPARHVVSVLGGRWDVRNGRYQLTSPARGRRDNANLAVHLTNVPPSFETRIDARAARTPRDGESGFSVVFDFVDTASYSYVALNSRPDAANSGVFRVSGGVSRRLAPIRTRVAAERWHHVRVRRVQGRLTVHVDGHAVAAIRMPSTVAARVALRDGGARIGVGTLDSPAAFDNLAVEAIDDPVPVPTETPAPRPTATPAPTETPEPTATPTPTPTLSGTIAFVSDRDGNREIYAASVDGRTLVNLTNNAADDDDFEWSPDATRIAFRSTRDGNADIYVMTQDGAKVARLTNTPGVSESSPRWSPDSLRLAWVSTIGGTSDVVVAPVDGSGPALNLSAVAKPHNDRDPRWSPDGGSIAFVSDRDGNDEIYLVPSFGGTLRNVTESRGNDSHPVWSLSGGDLWFESDRDGNREIYWTSAVGGGAKNITDDPHHDQHPTTSRDGSTLSFESNRGPSGTGLWVMPVWTGTPPIQIGGTNGNIDMDADWSPGSEGVAYTARQGDGKLEIFVVRPDGVGALNLTASPADDTHGRWRPIPQER
jgi:Tol biopolymer transport system component